LKEKLEAALKQAPEFQKLSKNIQITVTGEGLRIELLEDEKGMFFQSGSPNPSEVGVELVTKLAEELGKLPNRLFLEGHTDAKPFASATGYSNWELSADRANAARRIMMEHGVRSDQVAQVRGFADQRLRVSADSAHASNRRVSVIVQYMEQPKPAPDEEENPAEGHGEKKDAGHEAKPADHGKKH